MRRSIISSARSTSRPWHLRASLVSLLTLVALLIPGTLWAHAHLLKSTPAAGARLSTPPDAIRLWYSEAPEVALTRIVLLGPSGDTVRIGAITKNPKDAKQLSIPIPVSLAAGQYTLIWHTSAADGHPTHGQFTFTVLASAAAPAAPATQPRTSTPSAAAPSAVNPSAAQPAPAAPTGFGVNSPLYVVVRAVTFAALLALLGVIAFQLLVLGALRRRSSEEESWIIHASAHAAWVGAGAAVVLVLAAIARAYAESYAVFGGSGATGASQMRAMLGHTVWGWGWIAQVILALIAIALF
ncbi:MAG TPA: copper resistance protein CopC, partial [Gemmatimonadaceae bacterium]|nr:copper resistance protein CopC [Gemmatimonadaceae bacterium]